MKTPKSKKSLKTSASKVEIVSVAGKEAKITRHDRGGYVSFRVRFWQNGKRKEITAPDLETARQRAKDALKHHESGSGHVIQLTPKASANVAAAVSKLQEIGIPLLEAVTAFTEAHTILIGHGSLIEAARYFVTERKRRAIPDITIPDLVKEFLDAKKQDGCSQRYLDDCRLRLDTFKNAIGGFVGNVTTSDIDTYLRGLSCAARSRHNVHVIVRSLFSFARSKGYLPSSEKTAAEIVGRIKLKPSSIGILKPEEFEAVLRIATPKTLPAFVLGGFCGLRQAEIFRLDWSAIDFKRGLVTVNADIAKTARRRLVPLPAAASKWLKSIAEDKGQVIEYSSEINLSIMMRSVWEKAKLPPLNPDEEGRGVHPTQNCLRHSAASYRLAQTGDAARTALELGNSPKMLMEHYRELVTKEDAEEWFSIVPKKTKPIFTIVERSAA